MQKTSRITNPFYKLLLSCIILNVLMIMISCTVQNEKQEQVPEDTSILQPDEAEDDPLPAQSENEYYYQEPEEAAGSDYSNGSGIEEETDGGQASMLRPPDNREEYRVILGADSLMKLPGLPGELRVWIGDSSYSSNMSARMARDTADIPALGEWATINPFAPGFQIEPPETPCITIHPSGSEVIFELIPERSGTFEVGVTVNLYNSSTCSGSPIPKTAANLMVTVEVDRAEKIKASLSDLWNIFWLKLLDFWGALLALFFGLILFIIRGRLKRWFGYNGNRNEMK